MGKISKQGTFIGIICTLIVFLLISFSMGVTSGEVSMMSPIEAINVLAFSFAFGLGFSQTCAYITATFLLIGLLLMSYLISSRLFQLVSHTTKSSS